MTEIQARKLLDVRGLVNQACPERPGGRRQDDVTVTFHENGSARVQDAWHDLGMNARGDFVFEPSDPPDRLSQRNCIDGLVRELMQVKGYTPPF